MDTQQELDSHRRNLKTALDLASAGIRVFPAVCVAKNGSGFEKRPLVSGWQKAATTDREQLVRWWRRWPHAVPGLPLNGHVVIDADRHGDVDGVAALQELVADYGGLPAGPVTETAGGGLHHIFKQPSGKTLRNRRGSLPRGIDVRGVGGWIVAPGSVRPDGKVWAARLGTPPLAEAYATSSIPDIPLWLVSLIEATPDKATAGWPLARTGRNFDSWARDALARLYEGVRRATTGIRNETLNKAAFVLGGMVAREWLDQQEVTDALWQASEANGLVKDDGPDAVQATIASGFQAGLRCPATDPEDAPCNRKGTGAPKSPKGRPAEHRRLISRRLSDVEMRRIEWVWPSRIAVGKHTTLAGEPGIGKSTVLYWIAAAVSTGKRWPCDEGTAPKGSVIILSAEDGAEDTIAPRIAAAGGDLRKVHVVTAAKDNESKISSFNLQSDLDGLEKLVAEIGDVCLVIIDPISSYLGKVDGHSNTDVRSVVEPLHEMADRLKVAVITNTHFAKSGAANRSRASHRVIGSTAFIALPRVVLAVTVDPENEDQRFILHLKNNIAKPPPGLAFTLVQAKVGNTGEPPNELYASCVEWEAEHVSITADEAIAEHEGKLRDEACVEQTPQQREAEDFLRSWLVDGDKPAKDIERAAKVAGISSKILRTVRERICNTSPVKDERGKIVGHQWSLKPETRCPPQSTRPTILA